MDECRGVLPTMQCLQGGSDVEGSRDEAFPKTEGANSEEAKEKEGVGGLPLYALIPYASENRLSLLIDNQYFQEIILKDDDVLEEEALASKCDIFFTYNVLAIKDTDTRLQYMRMMRDMVGVPYDLYSIGRQYLNNEFYFNEMINDCYRRAQEVRRRDCAERDPDNPVEN